MKLKDLISKLQALNPEAEVFVRGYDDPMLPLDALLTGQRTPIAGLLPVHPPRNATPSDTLIVLSE